MANGFVNALRISIVDKYDDTLVFSTLEPLILELENYAYMLDFCHYSANEDSSECLSGIAYGQLKIEDEQSGTVLLFNLDMLDGDLSMIYDDEEIAGLHK